MLGIYKPTEQEIDDCISKKKSCAYGICEECILNQEEDNESELEKEF